MDRVAVFAFALSVTAGCTDRAAVGELDPGDEDPSTSGGAAPGTGDPPWPVTDGGAPPMPPPREDTGTSEGSDGVTFIMIPDGGSLDFECDTIKQDCPPGQKCMPYAIDGGAVWNATACFPIARDPVGYGETCEVEGGSASGIDDCDAGMMCWNVDREGFGHCVHMCTGSSENPTCPLRDETCSLGSSVITICLSGCDPLIRDCTIEGEVCYPINDKWVCAADASGDAGAFGDPCEFINACDPFHACVGEAAVGLCPGAAGCCTRVCDVFDGAADAECAALAPGLACEGWWREGQAPPGYEHVGVCVLPL